MRTGSAAGLSSVRETAGLFTAGQLSAPDTSQRTVLIEAMMLSALNLMLCPQLTHL